MPSKAERIAARVQAVLTGTTLAGANVWADRDDAFTREESPAILIELAKEDTEPMGGPAGRPGGMDRNRLELSVIFCVRGAAWRSVADAVRVQTHALLMADAQLQGLVSSMRRSGGEWKSQSADQPFGYAAQFYTVQYTSRTDALDLDP